MQSFGYPRSDGRPLCRRRAQLQPGSAAFGALVNLAPQWQLTSNLAYTERAPKDYELFANGPHLATAAWEIGDPDLQKEKSTGFDIGAQWTAGANNARVNAYVTRFSNYIGLAATGRVRGGDGEVDPRRRNARRPAVSRHAGRIRLPRRARPFHRHRGQRQPATAGRRRLLARGRRFDAGPELARRCGARYQHRLRPAAAAHRARARGCHPRLWQRAVDGASGLRLQRGAEPRAAGRCARDRRLHAVECLRSATG